MGRPLKQAPMTCEVCGKTRMMPESMARVTKFCSRACYTTRRVKHPRVLTCELCGKNYPNANTLTASRLRRYCSNRCRAEAQRKGGYITQQGYRVISIDGKPVLEHRQVMEKMIGRPLLKNESVHHRNGDRLDNAPANLELWVTAQLGGQRASDLVAYVVEYHRAAVLEALAHVSQPHSVSAPVLSCEAPTG